MTVPTRDGVVGTESDKAGETREYSRHEIVWLSHLICPEDDGLWFYSLNILKREVEHSSPEKVLQKCILRETCFSSCSHRLTTDLKKS